MNTATVGLQTAPASTEPSATPRIYVACLADYARGGHHGAWIDAAQTSGLILADIKTMLAASPCADAEEWAIHDTADFEPHTLAETAGLDEVAAVAAGIVEHGELFRKWLTTEIAQPRYDSEDLLDKYDDSLLGHWDDTELFAREILHERLQEADPLLVTYFDFEAYVRDMVLNREISVINMGPGIVVFRHPGPPEQHVERPTEPPLGL